MKTFSAALLVVALLLASAPTSAQTVITRLGRAPVTQTLHSTAQLVAHRRQILEAARALKLTQGETEALADALNNMPQLFEYVVLPRHLDAMTGSGPNGYDALFNVTIPANTHGWALAYSHGSKRTLFYIPAACGNVSIVRSLALPVPAVYHKPPVVIPPTDAPVAALPAAEPAPVLAPTFAPNPGFWARYGPIIGGILVPIVGCAIAGCFAHHGGPPVTPPHHKPTPTPRPTRSPHPTPTPSMGPTPTPHPTMTPHPTPTPSIPPTPTPHPTMTPHPTPTPSIPPTPTPHPTMTPTPHPTMTPTPTPTMTPTPHPTMTPTPHPTMTPTPYPTMTPTPHPTMTPTPYPTMTPTPHPTMTPTPTPYPTMTPTPHPTMTPTPYPTMTPTPYPTMTPTPYPTMTPCQWKCPPPTPKPTTTPCPPDAKVIAFGSSAGLRLGATAAQALLGSSFHKHAIAS